MLRFHWHSVYKAERKFYENSFKKYKSNTRETWKTINSVLNNHSAKILPSQILVDNETVTNKQKISDFFNDYFTNIGSNLSNNIKFSELDPVSYIPRFIESSIFLVDVGETELRNVVFRLKNSSPGFDDICVEVLKSSYVFYSQPLLHIINLSLSEGIFPDTLKIAKVIPIYKGGDSTMLSNYRPISILPAFSKIFERLMYTRLMKFIEKNEILYNYQFGFRPGMGTNLALISFVERIARSLEEGKFVISVFLDITKAFDTVNHKILANKLYKLGIRGIALKWLKSCLSDRKQLFV